MRKCKYGTFDQKFKIKCLIYLDLIDIKSQNVSIKLEIIKYTMYDMTFCNTMFHKTSKNHKYNIYLL